MQKILTESDFDELENIICENQDRRGSLMPILNEVQALFGCVPVDAQKRISDRLNVPLAKIYGVITFYSQFSLEPRGENTISVCLGTACYVKGAQVLLDKIKKEINIEVGKTTDDGKFSLEATRCIGACGLAPIVTVNDDVYGNVVEGDISNIIKKY